MPDLKQDLNSGTWRDGAKPADAIDIQPYEMTVSLGEKDTGQWIIERRAHNRYLKDPVEWHTSRKVKKGEREIMDVTNKQCWTECQTVDESVVRKRVLTLQYVEWWKINISLKEYYTYRGISKAAVGVGGGLGVAFLPAAVVATGVASVAIGAFMITSAVMKHLGPSSEELITGGWEIVPPQEEWGPEQIEKQSTPRWERCSEVHPCLPPKTPTGGGGGKQVGMGTGTKVGIGVGTALLLAGIGYVALKGDEPSPTSENVPAVSAGTDDGGGGAPAEIEPAFVVCSGTSHQGEVPGFPSSNVLGVWGTDPASEIEATHAGETQTDTLGPDHVALFQFGIPAFDTYPWEISADGNQIADGELVVDADEVACDEKVLEAKAKEAGIFGSSAAPDNPAVEAFVLDLASAFEQHDTQFILGHMDPAVIQVYGEDQCRAHAADVVGLPPDVEITGVSGPSTYTYDPDGLSVPVEGVYGVATTSQAGDVELHVGQDGEELTWFTDCGTPL